jgi:NAD+ kinase
MPAPGPDSQRRQRAAARASALTPDEDPVPMLPAQLAVVVHPSRDIDQPLQRVRDWSATHGVGIVQVAVPGQARRVADLADPAACQLIVAIGGDGTMLAALRAGAPAGRPVLGVASGSLGALASVGVDGVTEGLDRFCAGHWQPRRLPALEVEGEGGDLIFALNDISVVRNGEGQVRTYATVDGTLFGRFAGDGCVVSTAVGSAAYSLSAGGPLMLPEVRAFLLTPLSSHGGFCPPLVVSHDAELRLEFGIGHGGARMEVDGQVWEAEVGPMRIRLRDGVATVVTFDDQPPFITALRDRRIILDSPRITAEERRRRRVRGDAGR